MTGISVALLRPLGELLARLDAAADLLGALGVDRDAEPTTFVDGAAVDRYLDDIASRRGDRSFALTLAHAAAAHPLGLLGNLIWTSGTLRDALGRAVKFYGVVTQRTTLELVERDDVVTLRQHGVTGRGAILAEYPFASLVLRARIATGGRFAARAVRFAHAGVATAAYREVFGSDVAFGAEYDEIEIDRAALDLRLASGDPLTVTVLESTAAQLVAAKAHDPFLDRVRRAAAEQLASEPSLASIAKALGTSERTLRRQFEQHETSLRVVLDDVRRARADELLATGTPLKEIAFVLGFSEPSAFSRAYKRWTGKAPRE